MHLLLLAAVAASAQVGAVPSYGGVPPVEGRAVAQAAPRYDYAASLTLSKEDLADPEKFKAAAKSMFEGYLAHEKITGIAARIARGRFEKVLPWNYGFVSKHADSLTLSYADVEAAGEERFAQRTTFKYNGKTVDLYRYADGIKSATSVFIDGAEEKDAEGEPVRFFTSDEASFNTYVEWFHGRLGGPIPQID